MFRPMSARRLFASVLEGGSSIPALPWLALQPGPPHFGQRRQCQSSPVQEGVQPELPARDYGMELLCRAKELGWTTETMRKLRVHSMSTDKRIVEVVEWLNSLGISDKDAGDVVRRFPRVVSYRTDNLQKRVESLAGKLKLSQAQAFQIFVSYPVVASKSDEKLARTFSYLSTLGIPSDRIAKMMCDFPPLLGLDIEEKINSFRAAFNAWFDCSDDRLVRLITTYPRSLGISAAKLTQKLHFLESIGVNRAEMVTFVPTAMWGFSVENKMQLSVDWLTAKGFTTEGITKVVTKDKSFLGYSIDKLERNHKILCRMGLSDADIVQVFVGNPKIFGLALDGATMQGKLKFIATTLEKEIGPFLVDFPTFLNLSLNNRIAPRYAFCKKSGLKLPLPKLAFTASDAHFCESVVRRPLEEYKEFLATWEAKRQG